MSEPEPTPEDLARAREACVLSVFEAVQADDGAPAIPRLEFLARQFAQVRARERARCLGIVASKPVVQSQECRDEGDAFDPGWNEACRQIARDIADPEVNP